MSDTMLLAVLRMPYELVMASELSRRQFYDRAQEAADRLAAPAPAAEELPELPDWCKRDDIWRNLLPSEVRSGLREYARTALAAQAEKHAAQVADLQKIGSDWWAAAEAAQEERDALRAQVDAAVPAMREYASAA